MKDKIPIGMAIALIFITGVGTIATASSSPIQGTITLSQTQPDCNPKEEKNC